MNQDQGTVAEAPVGEGRAAPDPLSTARELALLVDLKQVSADRAAAETRIETEYQSALQQAETQRQESRAALSARYESDERAAHRQHDDNRRTIAEEADRRQAESESEFDLLLARITDGFNARGERARKQHEESVWEARQAFDGAAEVPARQCDELQQQLDAGLATANSQMEDCRKLLARWRQGKAAALVAETPSTDPIAEPFPAFQDALAHFEKARHRLVRLKIAPLFAGYGIISLFLFLALVGLAAGAWLKLGLAALWVALASGLVGGTLVALILRWWANRSVGRAMPVLSQAHCDAQATHARATAAAAADRDRQHAAMAAARDRAIAVAEERLNQQTAEHVEDRDRLLASAHEKMARRQSKAAAKREKQVREEDERHARLTRELRERYEADQAAAERHHRQTSEAVEMRHQNDWDAMTETWMAGLARAHAAVGDMHRRGQRLFPSWETLAADDCPPSAELPPAIRFGQFPVTMAELPHGVPQDDRLTALVPRQYILPALAAFPRGCSLVLRASGSDGRAAAVEVLQAYMLRLLTSVPPAKVRFTIVDPVGLGENFAAFMHLADADEALVTSRIWTDPRQIEQRLADLSEHMENVIQKYLRNEFAAIEDYNQYAGEIAEPFRFLVVANFPAGFSEQAVKRLMSIATTGARCGVFTLISVDEDAALPDGFNLRELQRQGVTLAWRKGRFVRRDPELRSYPLSLDRPPPAEIATRILRRAGRQAVEASRVEVPFRFIAPAAEGVWTSDSSRGIDVPLGRAGATRLQSLKLGHGTSQHVLVAGKTGSGKSTLLHALVTNLALRYSPDEAEVYLVDFKKGVEFKTYATHELPHARVIAIESDREFGQSVLERLDAELKQRADRFRALGVQDIAGYRKESGQPLPRIMLIVDEFQELFVEDDRIAQDAALLLDRLVRQGRAFGMHVLLGSQTLGGAYSLARSTIGQMAVRIALQCSEADAHLILSEDNTAARLLSRAGEAIYNDSNGLVEGNHPFQVVWLPDEEREVYLQQVQHLAHQRNGTPRPQVVFEGNVPAELHDSVPLAEALVARPSASPAVAHAWLGDAVAIKEPTSAEFSATSGNNLLVIGQNEDSALGLTAAMLVSLLAQHPLSATRSPPADAASPGGTRREGEAPAEPRERVPGVEAESAERSPQQTAGGTGGLPTSAFSRPRFILLDGSTPGSPQAELMTHLASVAPGNVQLAGWRELPELLGELSAEVARRLQPGGAAGEPVFLFVHGLHKFRDLRKGDDDFGFSRFGEEPKAVSPAKLFVELLKDGPAVGVHAIVWCDSLNNVNRAFERPTLREFEMRVLYQMSNNDSSSLIDSPAASKLGMYRALFHSEERGRLEKFRPYGLPTVEFLHTLHELLLADRSE
jgi:hypothetical protein